MTLPGTSGTWTRRCSAGAGTKSRARELEAVLRGAGVGGGSERAGFVSSFPSRQLPRLTCQRLPRMPLHSWRTQTKDR